MTVQNIVILLLVILSLGQMTWKNENGYKMNFCKQDKRIGQYYVQIWNSQNNATYLSESNRFLLAIFKAVCLTKGPNARLLTTIPSTKGDARLTLPGGPCKCTLNKPVERKCRKITRTSLDFGTDPCSSPVFIQFNKSPKIKKILNEGMNICSQIVKIPMGRVRWSSKLSNHMTIIFVLVCGCRFDLWVDLFGGIGCLSKSKLSVLFSLPLSDQLLSLQAAK